MALVTVIIPTYNRDHQTLKAIKSVINQTFTDWHLIIIDDGSEEKYYSYLKNNIPQDNRIILKQINHCGRVGKVRNKGIKESLTPYIAFLDSDDYWLEDKLALQLDYLKENPHINWLHSYEIWRRNDKEISQKNQKHYKEGNIFKDCLQKCIVGPSTVILKKELFQYYGLFSETLEVAEDYELWLRIASKEPIGYIEDPLSVKIDHNNQQLSHKYPYIVPFHIEALEGLLHDYYKEETSERYLLKDILIQKYRIWLKGAKKRNHYKEIEKASERISYWLTIK